MLRAAAQHSLYFCFDCTCGAVSFMNEEYSRRVSGLRWKLSEFACSANHDDSRFISCLMHSCNNVLCVFGPCYLTGADVGPPGVGLGARQRPPHLPVLDYGLLVTP